MSRSEFSVSHEYHYHQSSPFRWLISHLLRYKGIFCAFAVSSVLANLFVATISILTGNAFNLVLAHGPDISGGLLRYALLILATVLLLGVLDLGARLLIEVVAQRVDRDARNELYVSLLGKSQTFHNRQRVGDIMARAVNDIKQINQMLSPGFDTVFDSSLALIMPIIFIGFLNPQLLIVPLIFVGLHILALRDYMRRLEPVADRMREQFGEMNSLLAETMTGIEVVKGAAQEEQERNKLFRNAQLYWDAFVKEGFVQAVYLPTLIFTVALACAFGHGLYLVATGGLSVGGLISYVSLWGMLRFPVEISTWSFDLLQRGFSSAQRILVLLREETELDQNTDGHHQQMRGEIVFDHVSFRYGERTVLEDISFTAVPGQTIAIVGQTGSGKSTLTKLVNRIYDVDEGHILVDGVDVRDWSLDSLRSQISTIEQDIFLFSRTVAENISYSRGQQVTREEIEQAARDAQAHDFILNFRDGYETMVGERGITLSGGQRQRLAISRALLTDPRILILDDSTSAIDSATEDEIQKAIHRLLEGRTTLLITHRLSQIRWADKILVIRKGRLIDQGTHKELIDRCETYRRIFLRYEGGERETEPEALPVSKEGR